MAAIVAAVVLVVGAVALVLGTRRPGRAQGGAAAEDEDVSIAA